MRIAAGVWIAVGSLVWVALAFGARTTSADGEEKTLVERVAELERAAKAVEPKLADFERRLTALEISRVGTTDGIRADEYLKIVSLLDRLAALEVVVQESARRGVAASMDLISGAVLTYAAETRKLPASLDDLATPSPTTGLPYLAAAPRDPWGEPFTYRVLDPATRLFQIVSAGPDRTLGTKDDVTAPKQAK